MAITKEQLKNRETYIGGSEAPIIMGKSKFKKPFELALEKAGIIKKADSKGIYSYIGDYYEPKIQDKLKIKNTDEIEYQKSYQNIPFIGHTDGLNETGDGIEEIKVSSQNIKDCYNQYEYQVRFYMFVSDLKKAEIRLMNRSDELNQKIKELIKKYKLDYMGSFENLENKDDLLEELNQFLEDEKVLKKNIKTKKIIYDEEKEKEMLDKIVIFWDFVQELKEDLFFNHENEDEYRFMENKLNVKLGLVADNEIIKYDFSKIEKMQAKLKEMKKIKEQFDEEKEKLHNFMLENNIKKIDNEKFSITRKSETKQRKFNKKKYEEIYGEIPEDCYVENDVKGSVTIKLKGE